jgi:ketosteroid isomerase-like protein
MHPNAKLLETFYTAFQNKDYQTMQNCYHQDATFSDEAFKNLNSKEVQAMWQMLITRGKDLQLEFSNITADDLKGTAHWEATYTFSKTGNKVLNKIDANFTFKDGKIYTHIDTFNFHTWASQALGIIGTLLGWTSYLQNKVSATATEQLQKFMEKNKAS